MKLRPFDVFIMVQSSINCTNSISIFIVLIPDSSFIPFAFSVQVIQSVCSIYSVLCVHIQCFVSRHRCSYLVASSLRQLRVKGVNWQPFSYTVKPICLLADYFRQFVLIVPDCVFRFGSSNLSIVNVLFIQIQLQIYVSRYIFRCLSVAPADQEIFIRQILTF